MAALAFLLPGPPHAQQLGYLKTTAKWAIFVGVLNGIASMSYLRPCLGGDAGAAAPGNVERAYLLASCLTTVLGVALLASGTAVSAATVAAASPVWEAVLKRATWAAKVLTGGTLQFGLAVLHSCLGLCGRLALLLGVALAVILS